MRDRNFHKAGEADELFDRNAVASVFVFLELLEGDADMVGDLVWVLPAAARMARPRSR